MGLAFTVTSTAANNLHYFGEGCTDADGQAALAPLPIEALFGGAKGYKYIEGIGTVHSIEVGLQGITLTRFVFHKVAYFENTAIGRFDHFDVVLSIFAHNGSDARNDVCHLVVFAGVGRTRIDVRDMDKRFLGCVERQRNGGNVFALVELVSYTQTFQVLVAVELLVIVVSYSRLEFCFVFGTHHRNGIATEIRTSHCHDMSVAARYNGADGCAQIVHLVG